MPAWLDKIFPEATPEQRAQWDARMDKSSFGPSYNGAVDTVVKAANVGPLPSETPVVNTVAPPPPPEPGTEESVTAGQSLPASPPMMSGPTYARTPGHWEKDRLPFTQDTAKAMDSATQSQGQAAEAKANAEAVGQMQLADLHDEQARQLEGEQFNQLVEMQKQQAIEDAQREKAQALIDKAASNKVDPGRLFSDSGAAFSFLAILGGAIGGYNAAKRGDGQNRFMDQLNRVIDRDISAQEHNIDSEKWQANQAQNQLAALERSGMNRAAAKATLKQSMLQAFDARLGAINSSKLSADAKANIEAARADTQAKLANAQAQRESMMFVAPQVVQTGGVQADAKAMKEQDELYVPALGGNARTVPEAVELRKMSGARLQLMNNMRKAADLRERLGKVGIAENKLVTTQDYADLESIVEKSKPLFSQAFGQGAAGDAEAARYEKAMGGLLNFRGDPHVTARHAADMLGEDTKILGQTYGIRKAQTGYMATPRGLAPANVLTGETAPEPVMGKTVKRTPVGK